MGTKQSAALKRELHTDACLKTICEILPERVTSEPDPAQERATLGGKMMIGLANSAYPDLAPALEMRLDENAFMPMGVKLLINVVIASALWLAIASVM